MPIALRSSAERTTAATIEFRKLRKHGGEPGRLFGRKAAVFEPQQAKAIHLVVGFAGADVLLFQNVYSSQECSHFWPVAGAQSWEEALFLVGGVMRCSFAEVSECDRPGTALVV
jgi:hypothetical protein